MQSLRASTDLRPETLTLRPEPYTLRPNPFALGPEHCTVSECLTLTKKLRALNRKPITPKSPEP